jgi:hypothetical protein
LYPDTFISYTFQNGGNFEQSLLKYTIEGKLKGCEDKEEEVSCYWMTIRKSDGPGN